MSNGHLMINVYVKPTDCHQYLDYLSSHLSHIKRFIFYSQSLRARRLCSLESDVLKHCTKMMSWFPKRDYPESMIDEEMRRVQFLEKGGKNPKVSKGVPFVTCHPSLNCLSRIIKDNLNISFMSREAKAVFSPGHMVLFRSARRTSSYEVCTNVTETDTFSSAVKD